MSLIDEVVRLKELESKATQSEGKADFEDEFTELFASGDHWKYEVNHSYIDKYGMRVYLDFGEFSEKADADYYVAMRNAAPALIEVLGGFQEGDADRLSDLIDILNEDNWKKYEDDIEVLRRYQAMASKMEAESCDRNIVTKETA